MYSASILLFLHLQYLRELHFWLGCGNQHTCLLEHKVFLAGGACLLRARRSGRLGDFHLVFHYALAVVQLGGLLPALPLQVEATSVRVAEVLVVLLLLRVHSIPHPGQKPHHLLGRPGGVHVL